MGYSRNIIILDGLSCEEVLQIAKDENCDFKNRNFSYAGIEMTLQDAYKESENNHIKMKFISECGKYDYTIDNFHIQYFE